MTPTRLFLLGGVTVYVLLLLVTLIASFASREPLARRGDHKWALLLCFALAWYNVSSTWVAQLVMYPLYQIVGRSEFIAYHHTYSSFIPIPIIFPAVALSIASVLLVWFRPANVPSSLIVIGVLLPVLIWCISATFQFRYHAQLASGGFSEEVVHKLILSNWLRTTVFTAHGLLMVWMTRLALRS
jgi:hypothetical protein